MLCQNFKSGINKTFVVIIFMISEWCHYNYDFPRTEQNSDLSCIMLILRLLSFSHFETGAALHHAIISQIPIVISAQQ
jgi:hypothetical protein